MRLITTSILLLALGCAAQKAGEHEAGRPSPHAKRTAEEWVEILERPDRDGWQKPREVVEALNLETGAVVADIGAGTGYFSIPFARKTGSQGKVYAVEVQQDLIDLLAERAQKENLPNMTPLLGKFDDPLLAEHSVDLIFICNVVHHIEERPAYYAKLRQALRTGGALAVIDFHKKDQPVGPATQEKIAREDMLAEIASAGFTLEREHEFLPYQYFLVFQHTAR